MAKSKMLRVDGRELAAVEASSVAEEGGSGVDAQWLAQSDVGH